MRPIINAFVALTLLLPALALASATPQQVVEDTSRKVMEVLDANRETYRNDVEAFTVGLGTGNIRRPEKYSPDPAGG